VNNSRPDGDEVTQVGSFRARSRSVADATRDRLQRSPAGAFARRLAAVASSLQVIYERSFGQPHRGWQDLFRFITWAAVLFGVLAADSVISGPIRIVSTPVGVAGFFWWSMHFLLAGRVSWRLLLRPAIVTGLLWIGLELFAAVYFSGQIISDSGLYGPIGVVFSLMVWFIAIGAVIVLGATAGAMWAEHAEHAEHARAPRPPPGGAP
jgi:hypothetical protein